MWDFKKMLAILGEIGNKGERENENNSKRIGCFGMYE